MRRVSRPQARAHALSLVGSPSTLSLAKLYSRLVVLPRTSSSSPSPSILLLDSRTTRILSTLISRTSLLRSNVLLFKTLPSDASTRDWSTGPSSDLVCRFFVGTSMHVLRCVASEIQQGHFGSYEISFAGFCDETKQSDILSTLAQALGGCEAVIRCVDFVPLVTVVLDDWLGVLVPESDTRATDLAAAVFSWISSISIPSNQPSSSRRQRPNQPSRSTTFPSRLLFDSRSKRSIRLLDEITRLHSHSHSRSHSSHPVVPDLASEVIDLDHRRHRNTTRSSSSSSDSILLVLDRRLDPVTPLLIQWTYESMLHELIEGGIEENIIRVRSILEEREEEEGENEDNQTSELPSEIVLSEDGFFQRHRFSDWGVVCREVKREFDEVIEQRNAATESRSIERIRSFIEKMEEYKRVESSLSSHVGLVHTLRERVNRGSLIRLSVVEQELACSADDEAVFRDLIELLQHIRNPPSPDKKINTTRKQLFNLVLLGCLRFSEDHDKCQRLLLALADRQDTQRVTHCARSCSRFIFPDLFRSRGIKGFFEKMVGAVTPLFESEEKNALTQHKPLLHRLLTVLQSTGTLQPPFEERNGSRPVKPKKIFVVMLGGVTYAESRVVSQLNENFAEGQCCVHICSEKVCTSRSFLRDLLQSQ